MQVPPEKNATEEGKVREPNAGLAWLMGTHSLALARPRMPGFPWKDCMATDRIARQ